MTFRQGVIERCYTVIVVVVACFSLSGEFGLWIYNHEHLFVVINEHYKGEHSGDCKHSAGPNGRER